MYRAMRSIAAALPIATLLLAFSAATSAETSDDGEVKFNNHCRTCHSLKKDDNRLGPNLHQIIGKKAGTAPGYATYSQGLKSSGIVWDEKTLDQFIANPDSVIPSNNMKPYKGITDPALRAAIVSFLKSGGT